jgi:hypothetical protein
MSWRTRRVNRIAGRSGSISTAIQFRGSVVTSDAGLLADREVDDTLGLSAMAARMGEPARTPSTLVSECCGNPFSVASRDT